jgi:sulfur-oxidizing protein SoxY
MVESGRGKGRAGAQLPSTRREVMRFAGALSLGSLLPCLAVRPARATPVSVKAAIATVIGDAKLNSGRVKLEIPPLVENGNTVPMTVTVAHPMAPEDHVRSIHVFNEKNPQPNIANFHLGPHNGRAQVATRIRLADSQKIVAIAKLSDGSFWSVSVDVVVTLAACTEDVI